MQGSELMFAVCIGYTFRATPLNVLHHNASTPTANYFLLTYFLGLTYLLTYSMGLYCTILTRCSSSACSRKWPSSQTGCCRR